MCTLHKKVASPTEPVAVCGGPTITTSMATISSMAGASAASPSGEVSKTSYPAVLKGRSAASPPNPNVVSTGKVPPPVPPRGGVRNKSDRGEHAISNRLHADVFPLHALPQIPEQNSRFDEEEFVSVERINDQYVIRTSPSPFRPDRKKRYQPNPNDRHIPMNKFTYFINPKNNESLMNFKLSRKDKKLTETYHEKLKKKEMKDLCEGTSVDGPEFEVRRQLSKPNMSNLEPQPSTPHPKVKHNRQNVDQPQCELKTVKEDQELQPNVSFLHSLRRTNNLNFEHYV